MLHVMASGVLVGVPQLRTSVKGAGYCTGNLRVSGKDGESAYVSFIAFDEAVTAELLELRPGHALAIAGPGKLTAWSGKDGTERHGLSVVAERVLPHKPAPKAPKPKPKPTPAPAMAEAAPEFDDAIPF